jgi:hypothetical protein
MGDTQMWVDPHTPTHGPLVSEKLFGALKQADICLFTTRRFMMRSERRMETWHLSVVLPLGTVLQSH